MNILENRKEWEAHFKANWLAHYEKTGETDWKQYQYVKNTEAPSGKAIDLSQSKLLLVTSAGAYLRDSQTAFDASNLMGDYTVKTFPQSTNLADIAFAHEHYNHQYVDQDPQSVLPLRILEDMQAEGIIGELAENIVAFHGYTPNISRLLDETIPQIIGLAKDQQVDCALLIPV
ncbi:MAG: hypothetical protein Phog2KO_13670 [Phototrophicaceae bacterium]